MAMFEWKTSEASAQARKGMMILAPIKKNMMGLGCLSTLKKSVVLIPRAPQKVRNANK